MYQCMTWMTVLTCQLFLHVKDPLEFGRDSEQSQNGVVCKSQISIIQFDFSQFSIKIEKKKTTVGRNIDVTGDFTTALQVSFRNTFWWISEGKYLRVSWLFSESRDRTLQMHIACIGLWVF